MAVTTVVRPDGTLLITGDAPGDVLIGGAGADELNSFGANSTLDGGAGSDLLLSLGDNSTLIGGPGDDSLIGLGAGDTFKFTFTRTQGQGETFRFTDFLSQKFGGNFGDHLPDTTVSHHDHDHDDDDDHDDDHDHDHHQHHGHGDDDEHHAQGGGLTENFFEKNYKEWLKEVVVPDLLAQGFTLDTNGDGKIKVGVSEVDLNEDGESLMPRIEGLTQEQVDAIFGDPRSVVLRDGHETEVTFFSNSYTSPGGGQTTVTSTDGFDTIVGFDFAVDKLQFDGLGSLTLADFTTLFNVTVIDADHDGIVDDTQLALLDNTWGVSLLDDNGVHGLSDFHTNIFL